MHNSLRLLLKPLLLLGLAGASLQATLRYDQPEEQDTIASRDLDEPYQVNVYCSGTKGVRLEDLKDYISDFCNNYVYLQPGDITSTSKEYALIQPWSGWTVTFAWRTKNFFAGRSCEMVYGALTSKDGCSLFEDDDDKAVVSMKARGNEHTGPETYTWVITPPDTAGDF